MLQVQDEQQDTQDSENLNETEAKHVGEASKDENTTSKNKHKRRQRVKITACVLFAVVAIALSECIGFGVIHLDKQVADLTHITFRVADAKVTDADKQHLQDILSNGGSAPTISSVDAYKAYFETDISQRCDASYEQWYSDNDISPAFFTAHSLAIVPTKFNLSQDMKLAINGDSLSITNSGFEEGQAPISAQDGGTSSSTYSASDSRDTCFYYTVVVVPTAVKKVDLEGSYYNPMAVFKPVIYLYPTKADTDVTVKLSNQKELTCSYPKYGVEGWQVIAGKDGSLVDKKTGRSLYSLYYECNMLSPAQVQSDGFCIKGSQTASFLEAKLAQLGLTQREAEEFIIYWLPKLQDNKYNYIRFLTQDEIDANMKLDVRTSKGATPDTTIRVWMSYKGLDESISVKAQKLTHQKRQGFTAVEWGGTPCEGSTQLAQ